MSFVWSNLMMNQYEWLWIPETLRLEACSFVGDCSSFLRDLSPFGSKKPWEPVVPNMASKSEHHSSCSFMTSHDSDVDIPLIP